MKRRMLVVSGSILGVLVCLLVLIGPAAPLWQKLGVELVCIQGEWPNLEIVSCPQPAPGKEMTPLSLPDLDDQAPIPIIVDDDGSPDGTIALLYFLNNPLFDVRAVTISYGEAHPDVFARHVAQLLAGLGRADIPVGAGRDAPLEGSNAFPDPWRQSSDSFWNITLPQASGAVIPRPAAELIVETLRNSAQPVRVFVSGSHTNLAEALRLDPGIRQNIRDVYVMGGSIYVPGNIESDWPSIQNNVAEWNIWADPLATSEVFASGLVVHLVPLDATRQVTWTQADLSGWSSARSSEGALARNILKWMLDSWSPEGVYVWDLVAAAQTTQPDLCQEAPLAVEVITNPGAEQGRTLVMDQPPNIKVCLDPDAEQVKALAIYILKLP